MKRIFYHFLIVFLFLSCAALFAQNRANVMPAWAQSLPSSNKNTVYFVGKSERAENYKNYLEAKTGALTDILLQFSIYKNAEIKAIYTDYNSSDGLSFQEDNTQINFNTDSAGMYQQDEWMDSAGILYVLYAYSLDGKGNPKPDFPAFFKNFAFKYDRIYFVAKSVSSKNTKELSVQAEQNARIQAVIWLGAAITGEFKDNFSESNTSEKTDYFEGGIKCASKINLNSISLQEESRNIQKEQDKKYHYYGLYSINAAKLENAAENEYLTYNVKFSTRPKLVFEKQINISGNRSSYNKPFAARPNDKTKPDTPKWLNDYSPANVLWGIGAANCPSLEIQNIMSSIRAAVSLARQISMKTQSMLTEYKDNESSKIVREDDVTRMTTSINIYKFEKIFDELSSDNTSWQLWQVSNDDVKNIIK